MMKYYTFIYHPCGQPEITLAYTVYLPENYASPQHIFAEFKNQQIEENADYIDIQLDMVLMTDDEPLVAYQ